MMTSLPGFHCTAKVVYCLIKAYQEYLSRYVRLQGSTTASLGYALPNCGCHTLLLLGRLKDNSVNQDLSEA